MALWYRLSDSAGWAGWTNSRRLAADLCRRSKRPIIVGVCGELYGEVRESWQWTGAGWQRVI